MVGLRAACGVSPGYTTAHVVHQPLTLTETELSWLPSATGWSCPCQFPVGGVPALHSTAGFRESSCSLPEPPYPPLPLYPLLSSHMKTLPTSVPLTM